MLEGFENERLVIFDLGKWMGKWFVLARCPKCCRFLKHGSFVVNEFTEEVRCKSWICKVHGEVEPIDSGSYDYD